MAVVEVLEPFGGLNFVWIVNVYKHMYSLYLVVLAKTQT